jgi:hypothetical protein
VNRQEAAPPFSHEQQQLKVFSLAVANFRILRVL